MWGRSASAWFGQAFDGAAPAATEGVWQPQSPPHQWRPARPTRLCGRPGLPDTRKGTRSAFLQQGVFRKTSSGYSAGAAKRLPLNFRGLAGQSRGIGSWVKTSTNALRTGLLDARWVRSFFMMGEQKSRHTCCPIASHVWASRSRLPEPMLYIGER